MSIETIMNRAGHKSTAQFIRYVGVGGFNTLFGYGVFALLNWIFSGFSRYGYLYAGALGNLVVITVAFLAYKWFVFRTKGNYWIEWVRCVGVYGSMIAIGLAGLAILVPIFRRHLERPVLAPYLAAAVMTCVGVVIGFLGHKNISFRQSIAEDDAGEQEASR